MSWRVRTSLTPFCDTAKGISRRLNSGSGWHAQDRRWFLTCSTAAVDPGLDWPAEVLTSGGFAANAFAVDSVLTACGLAISAYVVNKLMDSLVRHSEQTCSITGSHFQLPAAQHPHGTPRR